MGRVTVSVSVGVRFSENAKADGSDVKWGLPPMQYADDIVKQTNDPMLQWLYYDILWHVFID